MNNSVIDVAFIAAKVAAIKDEKARMIVGGASLVYNVAQIARFRSMIVELSQICNYIVSKAQIIGSYTLEEYIQNIKMLSPICSLESARPW